MIASFDVLFLPVLLDIGVLTSIPDAVCVLVTRKVLDVGITSGARYGLKTIEGCAIRHTCLDERSLSYLKPLPSRSRSPNVLQTRIVC